MGKRFSIFVILCFSLFLNFSGAKADIYSEGSTCTIDGGSLNVISTVNVLNQSSYNATYDSILINASINYTYLTYTAFNSIWSASGGNASWNESYADSKYAPIGAGNASWTEALANTLYAGIEWAYNQTLASFDIYNTTWDQGYLDIWNYNQTEEVVTLYNDTWSSTYNATYAANVDTNETARFTNLTSGDCPANFYVQGVQDNGTVVCAADQTGEGGKNTGGEYIYNDSATIYSNDTKLNIQFNQSGGVSSINSTIQSSNSSWLSTYNATYDSYSTNISINYTINTFNNYNTTWDQGYLDIWNYNQTEEVVTLYNDTWSSTYNATYAANVDTNASTGCSAGEYLDGGGPCLSLNDSIDAYTASVTYNASLIWNQTGVVDSGSAIGNISIYDDGQTYNLSEVTGAPGFILIINFTGVTDFNQIIMNEWYDGSSAHSIHIGLYDYGSGSYEEEYGEINDMEGFALSLVNVLDPQSHISGGVVSLRLNHDDAGNTAHDFFLDYVVLVDGFTTTTTTEHDALSGRDNKINHPWAVPTDGSRNMTNLSVTGNVTAQFYHGDGSQLDNLPGNASWTEALANTLYAGIEWAYNQTIGTFNLYNTTWDQGYLDIWNYNQTEEVVTLYNDTWSSTYNATYAGHTQDNGSWNETLANTLYDPLGSGNSSWTEALANTLYAGIQWAYNQTLATVALYNTTWSSTYNATYDSYSTNVSINYTLETYNAYNDTWSSTYNATYDSYSTNVSINWTINTRETYNDTWSSTYNVTYDSKIGYNVTKNINMSDFNITSMDCIIFTSGGQICSN